MGPVKLRSILPRKRLQQPLEEEEKPQEKKIKEKPAKQRKPLTKEQILYLVEKLPPILGRALRRVSPPGSVSAAEGICAALGGGPSRHGPSLWEMVEAVLMAALPVLHRHLQIRDQDIRIYPDFQGSGMDYRLDVGIAIRLWDVLVIGLCAGPAA